MKAAVTKAMAVAGYKAISKMAAAHGYGWEFRMLAEGDVEAALTEVYQVMADAAPVAAPVIPPQDK